MFPVVSITLQIVPFGRESAIPRGSRKNGKALSAREQALPRVHWLLEADGSAAMWIEWARRKAQAAEAARLAGAEKPRQLAAASGRPGGGHAAAAADGDAPLEGVVVDAVTARKRARDEAWRAQHRHEFGMFAGSGC